MSDPAVFLSRDFDWLTGGASICVWLNKRAEYRPSERGGYNNVEYEWRMPDIDRVFDELFPPVEWPGVRLGIEEVRAPPTVNRLDPLLCVMKTLTARERVILAWRYGLLSRKMTLNECAAALRSQWGGTMSRERVKQIEAKAIRKMQHPVRVAALKRMLGK